MTIRPENQLPIEVIFNLLCVCRRGFQGSMRSLRAAVLRRGLLFGNYRDLPHLTFWIQVCRSASLLDEAWPPYPTLFAGDWFAYPLENQIWSLVRAWVSAPQRQRQRILRERLIDKLLAGAVLSQTYRRELVGLRALGICEDEQLSDLGWAVVGGRHKPPSYVLQSESWYISSDRLHVPYPPRWDLLWQLEAYLDPQTPGRYPLTPQNLRRAIQRDVLDGPEGSALIIVMEKGLGGQPPPYLVEALAGMSRLRVLPGPVLEFDDPRELLRLREKASFRRGLEALLSSRHVHLDPWQAPEILRRLYRQGLLSEQDLSTIRPLAHPPVRQDDRETKRTTGRLNKSDRIYLLSLLLLAEGLNAPHAPPPDLLNKLTAGLDPSSRGAAARTATDLLETIFPQPNWIPEEEPPAQPPEELLAFLEQAVTREESIDVLYQARGREKPEYRHLTPLLVEQRGLRYYLVAYCHSRRANRTFRLDRLRLIDFPPEL